MTKTPQIEAIPGMTPMGFKPKAKSWKPEVIADNSGKWTGNALRFATKKEAEDYVFDLAMRWTGVRDTRVVESEDAVNYENRNGRTMPIGIGNGGCEEVK